MGKSADWKKDSYEPNGHAYNYDPYKRTYGRAYRYDPYERTYGRSYSMDKKGNWKKTAYSSQLGGGVGARCTSRWQCDTQCCEGPYGQGRCVAKKIDWTNVFAYCPAECVGTIGGRQGTC